MDIENKVMEHDKDIAELKVRTEKIEEMLDKGFDDINHNISTVKKDIMDDIKELKDLLKESKKHQRKVNEDLYNKINSSNRRVSPVVVLLISSLVGIASASLGAVIAIIASSAMG